MHGGSGRMASVVACPRVPIAGHRTALETLCMEPATARSMHLQRRAQTSHSLHFLTLLKQPYPEYSGFFRTNRMVRLTREVHAVEGVEGASKSREQCYVFACVPWPQLGRFLALSQRCDIADVLTWLIFGSHAFFPPGDIVQDHQHRLRLNCLRRV